MKTKAPQITTFSVDKKTRRRIADIGYWKSTSYDYTLQKEGLLTPHLIEGLDVTQAYISYNTEYLENDMFIIIELIDEVLDLATVTGFFLRDNKLTHVTKKDFVLVKPHISGAVAHNDSLNEAIESVKCELRKSFMQTYPIYIARKFSDDDMPQKLYKFLTTQGVAIQYGVLFQPDYYPLDLVPRFNNVTHYTVDDLVDTRIITYHKNIWPQEPGKNFMVVCIQERDIITARITKGGRVISRIIRISDMADAQMFAKIFDDFKP